MRKKQGSNQNSPYKIVFYIYSSHGERIHEPNYPELNPLGGSETAAIRMAETMRLLGHNVNIVTQEEMLPGIDCDVFISLRAWQSFQKGIFPGKVNYLWCQDDFDQPMVSGLSDQEVSLPIYKRLNGLFMLSTYQQVQWIRNLHVPVEKIIATTNGIPLEKFVINQKTLRNRKPWAYYSSTPFRGLNYLLQAWPEIKKAVPAAQLHLFTSMKVYNSSETSDYEQMYADAKTMPGIIYRGSVGQAELRETIQKCRVLAYPCVFPETSCIAAMEAMAAGCAVVSTSLAALVETAWQNPLITPGKNWLPVWSQAVISLLTNDEEYERLALQNLTIAKYYDWSVIAKRWIKKFQEDLVNN